MIVLLLPFPDPDDRFVPWLQFEGGFESTGYNGSASVIT